MGIPKKLTARAVAAAAACLAALATNVALASPVTFNFDGMQTGGFITNFVDHGVTFSPSCHYDIENVISGYAGAVSNWIGFDMSGCFDGSAIGYNHDYLGTVGGPGSLYLGAGAGTVMSLKSLKFASVDTMSGGFTMYSSKGGSVTIGWTDGILTEHDFTGPQWTNLTWLVFSSPGGEPSGLDDLQLDVHNVDEPATLALMGLSMLGLAARRLKRRGGGSAA